MYYSIHPARIIEWKSSWKGDYCVYFIQDFPASDETTMYSTLSLIINQAEKYEIKPVITFDQSLY
jgi:hypothetical protein